ncbi:DUF6879 family protein [Streptomyces morookaense]|uniref:DUF6879 domain-containing protein n=1 Tax=Streptomyces morookaense TaxID=1970 RepID=A0A7Y7B7I4_STRMO|nr:DUF6879 family protein [Streptomyces morookaense]NVK80389.1 hypothetical protein [Streptomyces morookaense]GHF14373.1 hypothetical protein GCM10010359_14580 [Streptomyces morookaense]
MTTSSRTLGEWFSEFEQEAFRLETLDDYSKSGSVEAYQAFLAGKEQPESFKSSDWVTTVANATRAGKRMYRVHIVSRPLTDYLRFELGWGYQRNMTAGEEFYILDTTVQENPLPQAPDFWMFDNQVVSAMSYDGAGKFLGSEFIGSDRLSEFTTYRDTALAHAEPFPEWWAKHGE